MEYRVPEGNWARELPAIVGKAEDGDTIIVSSEAMRKLGERAHERMCPEKTLVFRIDAPYSKGEAQHETISDRPVGLWTEIGAVSSANI